MAYTAAASPGESVALVYGLTDGLLAFPSHDICPSAAEPHASAVGETGGGMGLSAFFFPKWKISRRESRGTKVAYIAAASPGESVALVYGLTDGLLAFPSQDICPSAAATHASAVGETGGGMGLSAFFFSEMENITARVAR